MKKPKILCPASVDTRQHITEDDWYSVCSFLVDNPIEGSCEIVAEHCIDYARCGRWREEKDKNWKKKYRGERLVV